MFLIGLIPWAALAAWAWRRGRAETTAAVPNVRLWATIAEAAESRTTRRPPWATILLLLAALLAVLAAAGPTVDALGSTTPVTLVVDDRPSMRIREAEARLRLIRAARSAGVSLEMHEPPDARTFDERIDAALRRHARPVVALTDRDVRRHGRVLRVPPATPRPNVAIDFVGVDDAGVLVRLAGDAAVPPGPVVVDAGGERREVLSPPPGGTREVVLPLPDATQFDVKVVAAGDAWPGDDAATVRLVRPHPRLRATGPVPSAVSKFVAAHAAARPAREESRTVTIGPDDADIVVAPPEAAAAAADLPPDARRSAAAAAASVVPDDLFDVATAVDWEALKTLRVAASPPGWRPLVTAGDATLLAYQRDPRRLWVGFDATDFAKTAGFVRLWAAMSEWVEIGPPAWEATPPARADIPAPPPFDEAGATAWLRRHRRPASAAPALAAVAAGLAVAAAAIGRGTSGG